MLQPALATRFLFLFCQCSFWMLQFPFVRKKIQLTLMNRPFVIGHSTGRDLSSGFVRLSHDPPQRPDSPRCAPHSFSSHTNHERWLSDAPLLSHLDARFPLCSCPSCGKRNRTKQLPVSSVTEIGNDDNDYE